MNLLLQPCYLLLAVFSEWVRQQQELVIEYLQTENQVLREKLGNQRIVLCDNQRRRLAVKGKVLGRKRLQEVATVARADTVLRWHRQLVVHNAYRAPGGRAMGRPCTDQAIVDLVLRMAAENVSWGYKRIQGALDNVGYRICSSTVANILKAHGVEPAPQRRRQLPWRVFLKAHWDTLGDVDLSSIFAVVQRVLRCLCGGVLFILNRSKGNGLLEESSLPEPRSPAMHRPALFGPCPHDPARDGVLTDSVPFVDAPLLRIRPPPSTSCDVSIDSQLLSHRAA